MLFLLACLCELHRIRIVQAEMGLAAQIEGEAGITFRIGDLLIIGLGFGIPLLKWLRKRKKEIEQSVKAAPPPAQEQTAS